MASSGSKPDYGIDAPGLVRMFFIAGIVALALCVATAWLAGSAWWGIFLSSLFGLAATYLIGMGSFMVYFSRITKVREREQLLDLVLWHGDEAVLDVGCGRGLMLVGAARRLTTGRGVGVDIWQAEDQSSNLAGAAYENAACEGVADRVEVRTADMRALPFADAMFDVVVSHWAVHNVVDAAGRDLALAEMVRVLKPGGWLILTDIEHREAYAAQLAALGISNTRVIVEQRRDAILKSVSFGSFRPATILAQLPAR